MRTQNIDRDGLGALMIAWCLVLIPWTSSSADEPKSMAGMLRLNNGDYVEGSFADSSNAESFSWQHPFFESSFSFPISSIAAATFPAPKDAKAMRGEFRLELGNGDLLAGTIVGIDEKFIRLQTVDTGELQVSRKQVRRLTKWSDGNAVVAADCGSLDEWRASDKAKHWKSQNGHLRSESPEAWLFSDVAISNRSRIDIEVTWDKKPNFVLAFGVGTIDPVVSAATAFRIEVWQDQLVAVWEHRDVADVAEIGKVSSLNSHLSLTVELDQESNRATVFSTHGEKLAALNLGPSPVKREQTTGFWLKSIAGGVSLESLVVSPASAVQQQDDAIGKGVFFLTGKETLSGTWTGVEGGQWILTDGETVHRVDPDEVTLVDFAFDKKPSSDSFPSQVQLSTHSGARLTGTIERVSQNEVSLKPDGVVGSVSIAVSDVRQLTVVNSKASAALSVGGTVARLVAPGTRLHGRLVDSTSQPGKASLHFEPVGSQPSAMLSGLSARLLYQEPESELDRKAKSRQEAQLQQARARQVVRLQVAPPRPVGILGAFARAFGNNNTTQPMAQRAIHLRTGEVIPCTVSRIDAEEIVFESDMINKTRLPTNQVRAIQLLSGQDEPSIEGLKRDRLLTVPRMRKKNPPTHLVIATNGDVMRCQLKRMTEDVVEVEVRLETIEIDRNLIRQIVWLDGESDAEGNKNKLTQTPAEESQVRVIMKNGNQMTLVPEQVVKGELIGANPILGQCRVRLVDASMLLIGDVSPPAESDLPFEKWKLSDAPEPIEPDSSGGQSPGMGSALVGTQAPELKLDLLNGERFSISDYRGKILVLDFWATWCGPCMQAMPIIEDTVREFEKDGVSLVTINLQEGKEAILATLERLNINPTVALDIDGVAAARYQADAIPQTVVIGRDGKISHLFVGGGTKLGEQLREAIRSQLGNAQDVP